MATKIITVEATPPSESTGADYNKGAPLNAAEFDQNIVNLRAAVDRKASLNNPTFTGTVTLPSTTSIGDVSSTELQYLNSVTSNVQDQINSKAPINNPTFTGTVSLPGGTANGVLYLNGSKVVTSGSALTFDGTGLTIGSGSGGIFVKPYNSSTGSIWSAAVTAGSSNYAFNLSATSTEMGAPSSGTLLFSIAGGEKMRLDASGNLGIGTSNPNVPLYIGGSSWFGYNGPNFASYGPYSATVSTNNNQEPSFELLRSNSAGTSAVGAAKISVANVSGELVFSTGTALLGAGNAIGTRTYTERMRLDSSGRLLVGTSSSIANNYRFQVANGSGGGYFECVATGDSAVLAKNTSGAGYIYAGVNSSGTLTYYVLPTGDVKNTNNSYGAISDQKLKENIVDASPKLDDLCKVKVRNFNLIDDEKKLKQIGVIAQELEEVFPSMVDETPDYEEVTTTDEDGNEKTERVATGTTTKSVKYSVFVPMLIKAIQEQQAIIESLTQRIEALEYKGE